MLDEATDKEIDKPQDKTSEDSFDLQNNNNKNLVTNTTKVELTDEKNDYKDPNNTETESSEEKESEIIEEKEWTNPLNFGITADNWELNEPPSDSPYPVSSVLTETSESFSGWRLVGASKRGKSHEHTATFREDAFDLADNVMTKEPNEQWWFIAVADGVGSAKFSRLGATEVTKAATETIKQHYQRGSLLDHPYEAMLDAITYSAWNLGFIDNKEGLEKKDLASTLLLILGIPGKVTSGLEIFSFQIGDGLLGYSSKSLGKIIPLHSGDGGEFANTVTPITHMKFPDDAISRIRHSFFNKCPEFLVAMTDGVSNILDATSEPILQQELEKLALSDTPDKDLLRLLSFERRTMFDDRTLCVAYPPKPEGEVKAK